MIIPTKIINKPNNLRRPIFSFKKIYPNTETKKYPLASIIGPIDSDTFLYANVVSIVDIKKITYAAITTGLMYSLILLSYFLSALDLSIICETEEINTEKINNII